jgi:hypothetical protein
MAGFGRAPVAAAADIGSASRGNFRDNEDVVDDADRGFPRRGERMRDRNAGGALSASTN